MSALRLDDAIPKEREALREKSLFRSTYPLLQWQRDCYLVGKDYADWRRAERQRRKQHQPTETVFDIAVDPSALGHGQLVAVAAPFIPSSTVRHSLLPLVVALPAEEYLLTPATNALVSLIQSEQRNLDSLVKTSITSYLQDSNNRIAIKHSTRGYIATKYQDSSSGNNETIYRAAADA
jgi:hypothetical protein